MSIVTEVCRLAIDAMGGDHGPEVTVEGMSIAAKRYPSAQFLLVGDSRRLLDLARQFGCSPERFDLRDTQVAVTNEMNVTTALRLRGSSMRVAIETVARGECQAAVSAGNTGALFALAKVVISTLPGIHRPAMAALVPSARRDVVMLDLGANIECDVRNLIEFAVMGDVFARAVLSVNEPTVALLNVGSEAQKGNKTLRQAADELRKGYMGDRFLGFVEGNDIMTGAVDVIVTDGFTGNVALKTGEGAMKVAFSSLRKELSSAVFGRVAYFLASGVFSRFREWADPNRYNGAVMLGLDGVVVKSHGAASAEGFANAIGVAIKMISHHASGAISQRLEHWHSSRDELPPR